MAGRRRTGASIFGDVDILVDSYGADARASALADAMELRALANGQHDFADLQKTIDSNRWDLSSGLNVYDGDEERDHEHDDEENERVPSAGSNGAGLVLDTLRLRSSILGAEYPFEIDNWSIRRKTNQEIGSYLVLLAITWAHTVKLKMSPGVEIMFEDIVEQALASRGLVSASMRVGGGFKGKFDSRLKELGTRLGMNANPKRAIFRKRANDAGADVIAVFRWGDPRHAQWWLVGQATCARSEDWAKKFSEPKPRNWANWLGQMHDPTKFLAVPHHMPDTSLKSLLQTGEGLVLDRLRLTLCNHSVSVRERQLVKKMARDGRLV